MPPKKAKRSKAKAAQGTGPKGVDAKTVGRWRSVRGRRGGLQAFMDMPVDVIQEICLFLHPQDLLSLSRVTKNFHEHLMSKNSAWIWKQSLGRVDGLPPRPSELIEPAWIALVYSPTCTLCGNGRATDVYWVVLARVCATCRKDVFVADNKVRTILNDSQASLVRGGIPSNTLIQIEGVTGFKKRCYFVPQLMDALQAYEALPHPRYLYMKPFIDEWQKRTKAHTEFASKCINWTSAQRKAEKLEAQRITTARLTDIGARLRDLGWDREVDFLVKEDFKPLSDFNPLWQVKALTDRAWQNMRSELLLHMEDVKAQRLERETWVIWTQRWDILDTVGKELLDRYYAKHPETMLYRLRIADLALEKEVRNIMCKPRDVDVGKEQFLALEGAIEAIVDRWQTRVCKQFRGLLTGGKIKASKDIDVLILATTMFSGCDWPRTHQEFPEVVGNFGVRPYNQAYAGQDAYRHFIGEQHAHCYAGCTGTSIRPVRPNSLMRMIVEICGKDPDTATAAEMDALDVWLIAGQDSHARNWRNAMRYVARRDATEWRLATAEERAALKPKELELLRKRKVWTCSRCDQPCTPTTRDCIEEHLNSEHGVRTRDITEEDLQYNQTLASCVMADCPLI